MPSHCPQLSPSLLFGLLRSAHLQIPADPGLAARAQKNGCTAHLHATGEGLVIQGKLKKKPTVEKEELASQCTALGHVGRLI